MMTPVLARGTVLLLAALVGACGSSPPASVPQVLPEASAPAAVAGAGETAAAAAAPSSPAGSPPVVVVSTSAPADFFVYEDANSPRNHYLASGLMGDRDAIDCDEAWPHDPRSGSSCIRVSYNLSRRQLAWAGLVWQDPSHNWTGDVEGAGYDLSDYSGLRFWARGARGGERATFSMGGLKGRHGDSARSDSVTCTLAKEWQEFSVPLGGLDLSRIHFGFILAIDSKDQGPDRVTIYLDDVRYVK